MDQQKLFREPCQNLDRNASATYTILREGGEDTLNIKSYTKYPVSIQPLSCRVKLNLNRIQL